MPLDSDLYKLNEEMSILLDKIQRQRESKSESYLKFFDKMLNSLSNFSAKINFGCKILTTHHFNCLENFAISIYKEYQISDLNNKFDRLKNLNINANNSIKKLLSALRLYFDELEKFKSELNNIINHSVNTKKEEMLLTQQSNFMKTRFSDEKLMTEMKNEEKILENKKLDKKVNFQDKLSKSVDFMQNTNTRNLRNSEQLLDTSSQLSPRAKITSKTQENTQTEEQATQPIKTDANQIVKKVDISKIFEDPNKITSQSYQLKKSKVDMNVLNDEIIQDYIRFQTEYNFVNKLGVNENAVVALCSKNVKELVVLKIFNPKLTDTNTLSSDTLLNISLVHHNILKTHHFIKNLNILVIEYVNLGQLSKFILQNKSFLEEKHCFLIFMQIIDSIDFLHNVKKIPHKNLNIDKFLINDSFQVKMSEMTSVNSTKKDSNLFQAPEINYNEIVKKPTDFFKADVYALGIILYFILFRDFPHKNTNKMKLSYELNMILSGMLNQDPVKRLSLKDVKNQDWLIKYNKEFQEDFRKFSYQKNKYAFSLMNSLKQFNLV